MPAVIYTGTQCQSHGQEADERQPLFWIPPKTSSMTLLVMPSSSCCCCCCCWYTCSIRETTCSIQCGCLPASPHDVLLAPTKRTITCRIAWFAFRSRSYSRTSLSGLPCWSLKASDFVVGVRGETTGPTPGFRMEFRSSLRSKEALLPPLMFSSSSSSSSSSLSCLRRAMQWYQRQNGI